MSAFGGMIFTNRGRNLQAKAQAGTQLNFTRIAVGDGELGGGTVADLTNLVHQVMSMNITKLKTLTNGKVAIGTVMSNSGLATGFYWRELGLFAEDPDLGEILYCYGNAGSAAEYIPAGGGPDIIEKNIDIITIIGNAQNVSATIEQSLVYATAQELQNHENNTVIHVTQADKDAWNTKETPAGAQAKVDAAMTSHVNDSDPHPQYAMAADLNSHMADYTKNVPYGVATGTNDKTITLDPAPTAYVEGMALSFKNVTQNTGAVTINVNGLGAKSILKSNGNALSSGNLKANSIYTIRYNGSNFILQGEGGEYGTAGAAQVLSGYTIGTENGIVNGTMPNNGSQTSTLTITGASKPTKNIPAGYTTGGIITAQLDSALASSIKSGVTIGGVTGTLIPLTTEKKWATGSLTPTSNTTLTVTGLTFQPSKIYITQVQTSYQGHYVVVYDADAAFTNMAVIGLKTTAGGSAKSVTVTPVADGFTLYDSNSNIDTDKLIYWLAIE